MKNKNIRSILLVSFATIVLSVQVTLAQSLVLFDLQENFPDLKSRFLLFEEDGGVPYTGFDTSNFVVKENGIQRPITSVDCDLDQGNLTPMTVVLAIDVSGSMRRKAPGADGTNIELAKSSATAYVKLLNLGDSECGITSFDDYSYINQDLTTNRDDLKDAIAGLSPEGGTDYNKGFMDNLTGALRVAAEGTRDRKVVIFLTDGLPETTTNTSNIISYADSNSIDVYCITLGLKAPQVLKDISEDTDGKLYESKVTKEDLEAIYFDILVGTGGGNSCILKWESGPDCDMQRKVEITYERNTIKLTRNREYTAPYSYVPEILADPGGLKFGGVAKGDSIELTVNLRANGVFNILVDSIIPEHSDFEVLETFPIVLGNKNITVKYTPSDSNYIFSTLKIYGTVQSYWMDACPKLIYVSGGFKGKINDSTLRVTHPNGGEKFYVGSDTVITWEGAPATDHFEINYSIDSAKNWIDINNDTSGLSYDWHVPNTPSDSCLAYVGQLPDKTGPEKLWETKPLNPGWVVFSEYSADGKYIMTVGELDSKVVIWDTSGNKVKEVEFGTPIPWGRARLVNTDPLKVAVNLWPHIYIREVFGNNSIKLKNYRGNNIFDLWANIHLFSVSTDGTKIFTTCNRWDNNQEIWFISEWNTTNGNLVKTFDSTSDKRHNEWISHIEVNDNNASTVVTGSNDGTFKLWNANTGSLVTTIDYGIDQIGALNISNDGNYFAGSYYDTASFHNITKVWTRSGTEIKNFDNFYCAYLDFSPDGSEIAFSRGGWRAEFYETSGSWNLIGTLTPQSPAAHIYSVEYNANGDRLVTASQDGIARTWHRTSQNKLHNLENGHNGWIGTVDFNSDNSLMVATGHHSRQAILINPSDGSIIKKYDGTNELLNHVEFSPTDTIIAGLTNNGRLIFWDLNGDTIRTIRAFDNRYAWSLVGDLKFSNDGKYLYCAGKFGPVKKYDVYTGDSVNVYNHDYLINWLDLSQDEQRMATASNIWWDNGDKITIWNLSSGDIIQTIPGDGLARFSPDGWTLLAQDRYETKRIVFWDLAVDPPERTDTLFAGPGVYMTKDESLIITISWDARLLRIYSADDLELLKSVQIWDHEAWEHGYDARNGKNYDVSDDESLIALYTCDGRLMLYSLNLETVQDDVSDSLWAIVKPNVICNQVDMGEALVNTSKEMLIDVFLENLDPVKVRIDTAMLIGGQQNQFDIVSTIPEYIDSLGNLPLEFRFKPTGNAGPRSADIEIRTQADTIICSIEGVAVENQLEVITDLIDFGCIRVGDKKDTLEFLLKNIGSTPVDITEVRSLGPDTDQFSIDNTAEAFTIVPDEEKEMHVIFHPKREGKTSGRIGFYYDGVGSPAIARLFGEGCLVPLLSSDSLFSFPAVMCEPESIDTVVIIENSGKDKLIIDTLWIDGQDKADFELTDPNKTNFEIDSGKNETIGIRFKPQTPGQKDAYLYLKSNAYNLKDGEKRIALSGYKEKLEFELSPKLLKFPNTNIRQDSCYITNTGTVPLNWPIPNPSIPIGNNFEIESIEPNPTPPNETSTIAITFTPSDPPAKSDTNYTFKYDCSNKDTLRLIATNAPMIDALADKSHLVCDTTELLTFSIENIGSDTLFINSAAFNDPSFTFDNYPFPDSLSPGEIKNYNYRFTKSDTGTANGFLTIHSNSDPDSVFTIPVEGSKDIIDFKIIEDELDLGVICPNTVIDTTFGVINQGSLASGYYSDNPPEVNVDPAFNLDTGETKTLDLSFNAPSSEGNYFEVVFITDTTCSIADSIIVKATIIKPNITTINELDLGMLCPGETIDTILKIENSSSIPIDMKITNPDKFIIEDSLLHLEVGLDTSVHIQYTAPDNEIDINETINIEELFCHEEYQVNIKATVEIPEVNANDLSLSAFIGDTDEGVITIENISQRNIEIDSLKISDPFEILDPLNFPIVLTIGSLKEINVRYSPTPEDTIPTSFYVLLNIQPCNVIDSFQITGKPGTAKAILESGSAKANPGSLVIIPIYLRNPQNVIQSGAAGFKTNLSFNATLLDPIDYPAVQIDQGIRTIELKNLPPTGDENSILDSIRFIVGLGDTTETALTLTNYEAINGKVSIDTICGKFTLIGICPEGGNRLLNPETGEVSLLRVNPNPVKDIAEIEYELIEEGYTQLFITDILGKKVKTLINGIPRIGRQKSTFNSMKLPTGTYFIILRTPTEVRTQRMEIIK